MIGFLIRCLFNVVLYLDLDLYNNEYKINLELYPCPYLLYKLLSKCQNELSIIAKERS